MKFKHVHIHNIRHLVPTWVIDAFALAKTIDQMLDVFYKQAPEFKPRDPHDQLDSWLEIDTTARPATIRFAIPDGGPEFCGRVLLTCAPVIGTACQVDLPLNPFLKGADPAVDNHCVYLHAFQTEAPLGYFGITKKPWYERLKQHLKSARDGSPYLFHRAIREHQNVTVLHKVWMAAIDEENALRVEEDWVDMFSLYPLGLNMIPGGRAGIRYLHKLGVGHVKSAAHRDDILESLSGQPDLQSKPNPLCAARWAADPSYVERVICGHSGRLTAEQVRRVRMLKAFGKGSGEIQAIMGEFSRRQIDDLVRGSTYQRIQ